MQLGVEEACIGLHALQVVHGDRLTGVELLAEQRVMPPERRRET